MQIWGIDLINFIAVITLIGLEYTAIIGGMYYYLFYKPHKLNLVNNPTIKKKDFKKPHKFKIAKAIDKVPEYTNRITCIILRENRWSKILYLSGEKTSFTYESCLYFVVTPHTCDNGAKLLVYLEGVSLPISYENIQKQVVRRKYTTLEGKEKMATITIIKGLKWDGKILHMFTNRKFAEIFTKVSPDIAPIIIVLVGIATLIISCICTGLVYYFGSM